MDSNLCFVEHMTIIDLRLGYELKNREFKGREWIYIVYYTTCSPVQVLVSNN